MPSSSCSSACSSPSPSRSTTPLSDVSSTQAPAIFVLIDTANFEATSLKSLFSKHAEKTRTLGVVIREKYSPLNFEVWTSQEHPTSPAFTYCVSCTFSPTCLSFITPDEKYATHLKTIASAGLRSVLSTALNDIGTLHILEQPFFTFMTLSSHRAFSPVPHEDSTGNIPTPEEWQNLWNAWDIVTLQMVPAEMLHQKPIDLRHKCLFYIGHIPTFLDMLLSKAIGGNPSEPAHFWNIFERGIDPHVDDPTHCHNHSEVPDKDEDWPTLDSIIAFRDRVRQRLMGLYKDLQSGQRTLTRKIARTLVMTLEHEAFHIETFLYMLIQRAGTGTLPPPGFHIPEWVALSEQWGAIPRASPSLAILGPTKVTMGHDDSEGEDADPAFNDPEDIVNHAYGWDNESPARVLYVGSFKAEWRPISNNEYMPFWREATGSHNMPKSWVEEDGEIKVRTLYGGVSMAIAGGWPLLASYNELELYAKFKGGRLPTEPELRLFLDTYDVGHEGGANVGFRNWHPVPATMGIESCSGRGSNGGVWEWTSTPFDNHSGLVPTGLFTGYSTDFFDGKHHVVLGASYATIPRLTRRTVRNFYQHNYQYPWVGARVVYDIVAD